MGTAFLNNSQNIEPNAMGVTLTYICIRVWIISETAGCRKLSHFYFYPFPIEQRTGSSWCSSEIIAVKHVAKSRNFLNVVARQFLKQKFSSLGYVTSQLANSCKTGSRGQTEPQCRLDWLMYRIIIWIILCKRSSTVYSLCTDVILDCPILATNPRKIHKECQYIHRRSSPRYLPVRRLRFQPCIMMYACIYKTTQI
jgi:hypothetical protein